MNLRWGGDWGDRGSAAIDGGGGGHGHPSLQRITLRIDSEWDHDVTFIFHPGKSTRT